MDLTEETSEQGSPSGGWIMLVLFAAGCLLAGAVGGIATATSVDTWYPSLIKPSWNPPSQLFGPVWTLLYMMMAVSAWMVWRRRDRDDVRTAMALFGVQLGLNVCWSLVFFGLQRPGLALLEIALLWLSIVATLGAFARISRSAAWLLVPYLGWVSFASALNFAIWRLNV